MKTKFIPAIIMLSAGLLDCIISIYNHMDLFSFTKRLLLVLIIFYVIGTIIKIVLDVNFKKMDDEETLEQDISEEQLGDEEAQEMENIETNEKVDSE